MMTLCVTVLFIITFSVFLLSIFVLVRFHEQPSDETIMIASQPLEMNQMNYQTIYSRFCDRLKLNYPELPLLFDDISIDESIVLHFKGLSRYKEAVVYVFLHEEAKDCFLSTLQQFCEDAATPKYGIVAAFPYNNTSLDQIMKRLEEKHIPVAFVVKDESSLCSFPHMEGNSALLFTGRKPYACFSFENDNHDYDWIQDLSKQKLFHSVYTKNAYHTVLSMQDVLSKDTCLLAKMYPLFSNVVKEEIMELYPEVKQLFLAVIDKQGNRFVLYTPDVPSLEKGIASLQEYAKNKKIQLKLLYQDTDTYQLDTESKDYQSIVSCMKETLNVERVLPVLLENEENYHCSVPVIGVSPLFQNTVLSSLEASRFYYRFLLLK